MGNSNMANKDGDNSLSNKDGASSHNNKDGGNNPNKDGVDNKEDGTDRMSHLKNDLRNLYLIDLMYWKC